MLNKRVVSVAALIVSKIGAGATFMKRNGVHRTLVEKPDTLIFFFIPRTRNTSWMVLVGIVTWFVSLDDVIL